MKYSSTSSSDSTRGRPATMASMMMPKVCCSWRVLVEVVQHDLADFAALQLDDDAHAVAVRLVADVGDAFERLVAHQVGDPFEQRALVDLVRDLGDDDLLAIALLHRLDLGLGAHLDRRRGRVT